MLAVVLATLAKLVVILKLGLRSISKSWRSYINFQDWIKKKKAAINPQNEDEKCFQYAATVSSNYDNIKWNPERVSNIKPFINKYNWEKLNYPSKIDDWKRLAIALNILYTKEKIFSNLYFES